MRNSNYCPRCKATFATEAAKNEHIMNMFSNPCQQSHAPLPEGLSQDMAKILPQRVESGNTIKGQWFSIWDTLFPEVTRPQTCIFDLGDDVHVQALGLTSYLDAEGPRIVLSHLRGEGIAVGSNG